jgi:hypothetical protein
MTVAVGRRLVALAVAALCLATGPAGAQVSPAPPAGEQLLERTLAIVGGAVVTLSDAALARELALVDIAPGASPADLLQRLVDRWLMLHEVARFAPGEPAAAVVASRLEAIRARAGGADALARTLAGGGRSDEDLETWVRDDLRIAAYLDSRFASAGTPGDADIATWVQRHAAELEQAGVTGAEATRRAREQLVQARRTELIADWLAELRRRVDVVTFPG